MRRGPVAETLSLFSCLNHLISAPLSSLGSDILNRITLYPFCSNTLKILVPPPPPFFFDCIIYETKFPSRQLFLFVCLSYRFNFSFDAQNFPFIRDCSHATTVPVSRQLQIQKRKRATSDTKWLPLILSFSRPGIYVATWERRGTKRCRNSQHSLFLSKIILERMTGSVVLSEVYARMYVVLSKAEKHLSNGDLVGTTECLTL